MNSFITTQIEASLGRKLITRADQFFSHSPACIIDEMVQNCRRAGARNVLFELDHGDLIISDDGHGLAAENAHILLMAGGSNNDAATEESERAAGLGFFSLAKYDVVVRSHNWEMQVPKEAFTGQATATLTTGHPHQQGLSLRIRSFVKPADFGLPTIIAKAIPYSGLTATLKGFPGDVPAVIQPKTFLDHALDHIKGDVVAVQSETTLGVTIKLVRIKSSSWGTDKTLINFFGKVLSLGRAAGHLIPDEETTATLDSENRRFKDTTFSNFVLIDVHDTSHLKLKLPERDVLIKDDGLDAIWNAVNRLYCRMMANPDLANGLSLTHPLREMSPTPIPRPALVVSNLAGTRWLATHEGLISAEGDRLSKQEIVGVALDRYGVQEGGYLESMLESLYGAEGCPATQRVLFESGDLEKIIGPGAYNHVIGNSLIIKAEGDEITVPLDDGESGYSLTYNDVGEVLAKAGIEDLLDSVVEDLALVFTIQDPTGARSTLTAPIPAIYFSPYGDTYWPSVLIAKGREDEAVDRMMRGIPWNDEESDYDPQERSARESYTALVAKITGQTRSHFRRKVQEAVLDEAYSLTSELEGEEETITMTVVIHLKKGSAPMVSIESGSIPQAA